MSNNPTTEDGADFIFKEKRKWQIALRRYVLNGNKSTDYAPYFGIDSNNFRKWIELQFSQGQNWDNFSKAWQFDHVVPVAFFDLKSEDDLKLCWNFINIQVESLLQNNKVGKASAGILAARHYYQSLYLATGFDFCQQMLTKIEQINLVSVTNNTIQADFIKQNEEYLKKIAGFTPYDYDKLNNGTTADRVIEENNLLKRFG